MNWDMGSSDESKLIYTETNPQKDLQDAGHKLTGRKKNSYDSPREKKLLNCNTNKLIPKER